ncbi:MAG: ribosome silencing factor [Clostridium sp.]|nr:ribosome silencing factor [Clostridium sp.]
MEPNEITQKIVSILEEKKARDISTINIREVSILADYFIICSGTSITHIRSLADEVERKMQESDVRILHKEGYNSARWILMDYGSVVIHIFHEEDRAFYNLERLWADGVIKHRE